MNILDRYGIKEVADVTFYDINADGSPKRPVLYLDTLKVTTIEQTAEETEARGGKGNAALIAWDYGKEFMLPLKMLCFLPSLWLLCLVMVLLLNILLLQVLALPMLLL